ncbi:MAG: 3-oxoadipate enol-lactonase [Thermomicrobiales bacterium]
MGQEGIAILGDGCRIAWRMDGPDDARVLMLSNSLGTTMAMWDDQIAAFSKHMRVLRYDTRGHGASSTTPGDYGLDRLGRDAVSLLDILGIEKVHFCGLSLGGMTAQWLAVFAPQRIRRLILANTSPYMEPSEAWQQRMDLVRDYGMSAVADAVIERWYTPSFTRRAPDQVSRTRETLLTTDANGYAGCCAAIRDMDLRPLTRLIEMPSLVIAGSLDPATPPDHAAMLADGIAGANLVTLRAAHLSNIECPEEFAAAVLNFLAQDCG